jgi:hypothetical protein
MFASNSLKAYEILQCLYVDDIGIPFSTRKDLQQGMELIFHHFARFGLEIHIGRGTTTTKTECVFFPPPQFFQHKRAREKAATTIQRAYRRTRKSRHDQPSYELEAVIETTGKTHHKNGTKVRKMFNDEYGVRRPFAGIVENYDETRELYWIVYEDGDSEEMTHEEVLLFWSTNTNIQPTQSPTALSIPPSTTFFAVGSRVTIIPSHHTHGGKDGVVTRHTAKFVVIALNGKETRILPKSILPHPQKTPNPAGSTNSSPLPPTPSITHVPDDDDAPTPDEMELEGSIYDKLDETQNVPVADGFISFTRTFRYLGSLISYSLRDDDDVTARIAAANSAMGALKEVWRNPHLDVYNKYLLFRAIPMNLLLWGCETWSLRQSLLDKLEVFLHRSVRRILQINMTQVKDESLRNCRVREMFYAIPCVRKMIAARQMDFVGKMIRGPPDRPARSMITACCNHKRRVGRPQTTGKNFMVENLRLLFTDVPTVTIDPHGSLRSWINEAMNERYWTHLVYRLRHPTTPLPERPDEWGPIPSWHARRAASQARNNNNTPSDNEETNDHTHESQPPPPQPPPPSPRPGPLPQPHHQPQMRPNAQEQPPPYDPKRWLNDPVFCSMVGRSMSHSLKILGLGLGASETEIKVHYRQLARKYHPDKNDTTITGLSAEEASEFFKLLNNANDYLKERA